MTLRVFLRTLTLAGVASLAGPLFATAQVKAPRVPPPASQAVPAQEHGAPDATAPKAAQATPAATGTPDPAHPGKAIYDRTCATCHVNPVGRAASFAQISSTSPERLRQVLTEGVMQPMAAGLKPDELNQLIGYLTSGQPKAAPDWATAMLCPTSARRVDLTPRASYAMYGVDLRSTRNLSAKDAGIRKDQLRRMDQAWAIGFPQTNGMGVSPVVVGSTVFMNSGGKLMAIDAERACAKWVYAGGSSRGSLTYGEVDGRKVIVYTAGRGEVHLVDATTGNLIWKADGKPASGIGSIRAAVALYKDKIIVPISASGVASGMTPTFECCTGHGAVVALSVKDGSRVWEYHTMKDAEYNGFVSPTGVKQKGPSGAPIWSTPTIDTERNRVIVTTGENTSHPGTDTSDAIISLDLDTGKPVWKFQAMEADIWNMACRSSKADSGPNCPWHFDTGTGRDFDFGGSAVIVTVKGMMGLSSRDVVLAGQKSGHLWALDAETGKKLWEQRVGEGTALGGNHWGIASDGERVYLTISDPFGAPDVVKPGVYAFRVKDGKKLWGFQPKADCGADRKPLVAACESKYGFSATPLIVDDAVIVGSLDGKVYALDGKNGKVLSVRDTAGGVRTANGVEGKGGSIDSHALAAGSGLLLVQSGYGAFGQTPGNVLIALKPRK